MRSKPEDHQQKLSRARISRAAVKLVDDDGLDALTMRRLGLSLGVEAMSLYRHVKNKADLLDAVHEAILSEMVIPAARGGWKARARGLALAFRDVLMAHPHALPIFAARPAVTPASMAYVERALAVLADAPIAEQQVVVAFQTVVSFIIGHTCLRHGPGNILGTSAYDDLDPGEFPHLARHLDHLHLHVRSAEEELERGLEMILSGIARG